MRLNARPRNGGVLPRLLPRGRWFVLAAAVASASVATSCSLSWARGGGVQAVRPDGPVPAADRSALRGRVAYSTRAGDIWVMNANGSGRRRLTGSGRDTDFDPSFSPDARYIVFRTSRGHYLPDPNGTGAEGIFIVGSRTKRLREIEPRTGGLFPAWSPDGSLIAFSGLRAGAPGDSIFVMRPNGTGIRDLGNVGAAEVATWSADSRQIAYSGHNGDGNWALWTMNRDGTHKRQLTHPVLVEPAGSGGDTAGAWSPDGKQIVYSSSQFTGHDLYIIDSDGGTARRLTDWPGGDSAVAWLRSGEIVFAHFTGDKPLPKWYIVKPDGTDLRSLPWFYGAGDPLDWIQPRQP